MPFKLEPNPSIGDEFLAKVGARVTVDLVDTAGSGAKLIHIRYAGTQLDEKPPFECAIVEGSQLFVFLVEGQPGAPLALVEKSEGNQQVLQRFNFDPRNPARSFFIGGRP